MQMKTQKEGISMPESTGRGALTEAVYYILLSLLKPLHGYGMMQYVSEISAGRVNLGAGTLYGAINTLLEKKWIAAVSDGTNSRKKEYLITPLGEKILAAEIERLRDLVTVGDRLKREKRGDKV